METNRLKLSDKHQPKIIIIELGRYIEFPIFLQTKKYKDDNTRLSLESNATANREIHHLESPKQANYSDSFSKNSQFLIRSIIKLQVYFKPKKVNFLLLIAVNVKLVFLTS